MNKVEIHVSILMKEKRRQRENQTDTRRENMRKAFFTVEGKILYIEGMMVFKNQVLKPVGKSLTRNHYLQNLLTKYLLITKKIMPTL